ncbi:hypothetical protein ACMZ6Z_01020 [Streptococcus pluranimalium]|uniref:hypothetical protein n=1 Tax=Streptococcus pluranimalium TaxID=82348 RepID=UPI0039FDB639
MKKTLLITLLLTLLSLLLFGVAKLYIAYNLAAYAGYYVQHMPRKAGTHPELAIIVDYMHDITEPTKGNVTFDLDGNGTVHKSKLGKDAIYVTDYTFPEKYHLSNVLNDDVYYFSYDTIFAYKIRGSDYQKEEVTEDNLSEAESLLDELLQPVLDVQPKPKINLQQQFNAKHQKRFN